MLTEFIMFYLEEPESENISKSYTNLKNGIIQELFGGIVSYANVLFTRFW